MLGFPKKEFSQYKASYWEVGEYKNNNNFIRISFYKMDLQYWKYGTIFWFYNKLKSKEAGSENTVL